MASNDDLIYWVYEREAIRKKRDVGQLFPPWTSDVILQTYRFCNVRRRHDRVSRWLIKNVLTQENLNVSGIDSFILFTALCRWINWPPTIDVLLQKGLWPQSHIDWSAVAETIKGIPGKVWTGAYMIRGDAKGVSKADYVVRVVGEGLGGALAGIKNTARENSRESVWLGLQTVSGFGSFMAGQVVDDWAYAPLLVGASDHFTWAPQGPGSLRGFNRIRGLPLKARHPMEEWCSQLQDWRQLIISQLGDEFKDVTLMDVQNCLCEIDKYLRVKNGEGRPRSRYRPETAY